MRPSTNLQDLIGIEHTKLDFYQELKLKLEELEIANMESENHRREIAAILDGITDVMMVLSEDMRIISVNHVFRELFDDPNPMGKYCYKLFRHTNSPCPECPAFKSMSLNAVCKETAIFRIKGRNMQFEMVASPIKVQGLPQHRVLIFKRDVTLEKEYQAKYYHNEKMATVGVLATGVAHEVNNPLMAISGYAEGIQRRLAKLDKVVPEEVIKEFREYTGTILQECNRCRDIVQVLLNFGHPIPATLSPTSVNDVVDDTLKLLHYHLKKNQRTKVEVDLDKNLPHIYSNGQQLKQVFLNLLTNASDALDGKDGVIRLKTYKRKKAGVCIEVSDTGCGIPPENMDKLFDPFFTTKPMGKGIGIGLSTCYNILKELKGDIRVKSEVGKGARFIVTLPTNGESING